MRTKFTWYYHRLSAMPFTEIIYRLRQVICVINERKHGLPKGGLISSEWGMSETWHCFREEIGTCFFWDQKQNPQVISEICDHYSDNFQVTLKTAEVLLNHRLEIFGQKFDIGDSINWHQDPLTHRNWPEIFWADIDYRNSNVVGGVKWVWEVNRHHHLVTLAKAFFLTSDERFANEALKQISSWIDQNPPLLGINWTSSLELAIRVINWSWVLGFLRNSSSLTEPLFHEIQFTIAQQATYISHHLSAYSSANNHRIGEAAGLAIVGMTFPWLKEAGSWKRTGIEILTHEIKKLIYPDGSPAEQAPHYLLFIMDFYFLVMRLAELNQVEVDPSWKERLNAAAQFFQIMMDKQGRIPSIGDNDDAWVVRLNDQPEDNNYQSVINTAAAWFQNPNLKKSDLEFDEKSWWLLGEEGKKTFEKLVPFKERCSTHILQMGGYAVMESASSKVVMDFGFLGYGTMAAHGHADSLGIWANLDGEELLVDSGTFAYQEGGDWRSYFRSTRAHNTLCVDNLDQSEMLGPFLWGEKANTRLLHWDSQNNQSLLIAEHNGYKNLGIIHRRSVLFFHPSILAICDIVSGSGNHNIEQNWHMNPKCIVEISNNIALLSIGQICFQFEVLISTLNNLRVISGQLNPIQGWSSKNYGVKEPSPVLSCFGNSQLPAQIISIFYNKDANEEELSDAKITIHNIFSKGVPG